MNFSRSAVAILALAALSTQQANATNGMNLSGYGPEAHAMGGASMAYDNGTAASMNNPATMGLMEEGHRIDAALGGLFPSIKASAGSMTADSGATAFYMPAMGWASKSGQMTYGVGLFSQGGMGTEYDGSTFMSAGSGLKTRSEVGVGRFIVPVAYQANDLTLGGSVDFVWAGMDVLMAMDGASMMDMFPTGTQAGGTLGGSMVTSVLPALMPMMNPAAPINWGYFSFSDDNNFTGKAKGNGFAGKLGFTYKVSSQLTIGGTYHSKTAISNLDASGASVTFNANIDDNILNQTWDGGVNGTAAGTYTAVPIAVSGKISVKNFQWPETYGIGMALQASDDLLLVADFKRIGWKKVMKDFQLVFTADPGQTGLAAGLSGSVLDATLYQNWDDQNVIQIGAAYKLSSALTVRGGLNMANNPVPDAYMNPLFPAVAKTNVSGGFGYAFSKASSVDASFAYVPTNTVTGGNGVKVDFGGTSAQFLYSYRY
ncbi:MAG: outer membrane protein transport protein [Gammaproteobacteria bacterium]|nr:outer membrane protein transport protein [Gammaproteobacteria bacterium]MBU1446963.1 outer membrane protein transport protein [Gammaproteobacteria bacterium]